MDTTAQILFIVIHKQVFHYPFLAVLHYKQCYYFSVVLNAQPINLSLTVIKK